MTRLKFTLLLIFSTLTSFASELPAQNPTPASIARQRFNQVFVKVIMPVTLRTPKQDGPAVESWVAERLSELGESEYFAVTDWVPVCDGLLADDDVDNHVWSGSLVGKNASAFCPVGGDLPERKDGRVMILVGGWDPGGGHETKVTLVDEPGTRAVEPVLPYSAHGKSKAIPGQKPLAYVAILIGPPPRASVTLDSKNE
ncbi:hypothetical protein [Allorhodopirellula heiligendammensis]|uniref:PrcB C-terminal domain-containing protein n=1 Tax=Allorhodopirellula heiligendammensis TaxID=2714739 RepID=A0A5C6BG30_9BACT|nr:hypothetical protein [Allorhodopirellula heiligendammensis]TWU11135.1 hypothetical protein Poly21_50420 [Allorhodopirellula heiligendammensis]